MNYDENIKKAEATALLKACREELSSAELQ